MGGTGRFAAPHSNGETPMRIDQIASAVAANAALTERPARSLGAMSRFFRTACISLVAAVASAGSVACSASPESATASPNGNPSTNADGGANAPGADGGSTGNAGNGDGTISAGTITISQDKMTSYDVSVGFMSGVTPRSPSSACAGAAHVVMGACSADVYCVVPRDAGAPLTGKDLNAGTIKISGNTGSAGPKAFDFAPVDGYPEFRGNDGFYAAGDVLTVTGAGGPDLPAFPAQTLVGPADVTFTAPCTGTGIDMVCPDLDRTVDLPFTWAGGAAGKVTVLFTTLTPTLEADVVCTFNAADGAGTIPAAALGLLAKSGNGSGILGTALFSVSNVSPTFMVGSIPTTFEVQGTGGYAILNVSK